MSVSLQESPASALLSETYALGVLETQVLQTHQLENIQSGRAVRVTRDQEDAVKPSEG